MRRSKSYDQEDLNYEFRIVYEFNLLLCDYVLSTFETLEKLTVGKMEVKITNYVV